MGISIYAYRKIEKIDCVFNADGEPIDRNIGELLEVGTYIQLYKNSDFPGRASDIENKAVYKYEDSESFYSASYGYYNVLRNRLAKIAGYKVGIDESFSRSKESYCVECWEGKTGPFSEIINFSDCEGVIGAVVSKKLLKDFEDFQEKSNNEGEDFLSFYNSLKDAFKMASDKGVVEFC